MMSRNLSCFLLESYPVILHSKGGQLRRMERKKGDPYPTGQSRGLPWAQAFNLAKVAGSLEMMPRKATGVRYQTSKRLPGREDLSLHIILSLFRRLSQTSPFHSLSPLLPGDSSTVVSYL